MQTKMLILAIIFVLILTPMYSIFSTAVDVAPVGKFGTSNVEGSSISSNEFASRNACMQSFLDLCSDEDVLDFEKVSEWSEYVYMDNDSVELVLGIEKADFGGQNEIVNIVETNNGRIVNEIWMKHVLQAIVVDLPFSSVYPFVREIQSFGGVRYLEPNAKFNIHFAPNDSFWNLQWGPQKIAADWAWNTTTGNREIIVAVVDTGIYWSHLDLADNYIPGGYDWVNDDADPLDDNGHGTHCAGTIAAVLNNSIGIAGMAQVRVIAEKGLDTFGSGNGDDLAEAIVHAVEQNASIISMSWGSNSDSKLIYEAIKFAYDSGVLLVASAGNSRSDIKSYPAAYDEVIAVSATDKNDQTAFFSNFGDWVELAAPGVQIYSTVLNSEYDYKSGTSMACPHVAGLSALVWSSFPNMTRDQIRFHLRYTADDLGESGFDEHYGSGRVNATKAVNQFLPTSDLLIMGLDKPPYVELNSTGVFNATILNYGSTDESNLTLQLLANSTYISSENVDFLPSGLTASVSLSWTPTIEGLYNITIVLLPELDEMTVENNFLEVSVYGGTPLKAFVIRSSGTYWAWITATWEELNKRWFEFGNTPIFIDSTTLVEKDIVYEDIENTGADVLIISSAYSPDFDMEFTDSEIDAITRYVYEGHGLIVTANTLSSMVPNNNKLSRLLGLDETTTWNATLTSSLNLLAPDHPIFRNISTPYTMTSRETAVPSDRWMEETLVGGEYVALGASNESAIVTYRGLVYSSPAIESHASQKDLQLLYNSITWSQYEKPEHDLIVGLEAPTFLLPSYSTMLNATVSNIGINNETNVELQLLINDNVVGNVTIPELPANSSYTINYLWAPLEKATHNVTAYVAPVVIEDNLLNNRITRFVTVSDPIIQPVEGQWANYTLETYTEDLSFIELINFTYNNYISPFRINVTYLHSSYGNEWTTSSIVNVMNRRVEKGTWIDMFYPGWIETNVSLGSKVRVLNSVGTIVSSQKTVINNRPVEYWSLFVNFSFQNYTFYYDKATGLLVGYDRATGFFQEDLELVSTNILIGTLIHPKIGDYAKYNIVHIINSNISALGTMNFSYMGFLDNHRVQIQIDYALTDINGQLIENFTELIEVNIQTRIIENGPTDWNDTHYFGLIETNIDLASSVKIWNQTGTVIGASKYAVGQRVFDTWLIYAINATQLCLYDYDKTSGLLIKSTTSNLNNTSQNVTFTLLQTNIDVTSPAISFMNPKNNEFINTTSVEIQWNGSDNEGGIAYYLVFLDSVEVALCQNNVSTYLFAELAEGGHVIKVEAYDLAGNMNSAEVAVVIDVTPPSLFVTTPSNGSHAKSVVSITFEGDDAWFDFMQLKINNVSRAIVFSEGEPYTYLWNTTSHSDGVYTITIVAYDKAQNKAICQITVTVDNTIPSVQIIQPADFVKGISSVVISAFDANLKNVSLSVNDQIIDVWTFSGIHTSAWNTTAALDGNYTLKAKVFDKAENSMIYSRQVRVDNTLPISEIILPTNETHVSGISHINLTLSDENLENGTLLIDGEIIADVTNATYYQWNTTEMMDGQHVLMLRAVDKAGNAKTSVINVEVDNTNPIVIITSPNNGSIISGSVTFKFAAWDQNLKNTTLILDGATFNMTNNTVFTLDTKTLQDGTYTVRLLTFDLAENQAEEQTTITADNVSPTINISSPSDGAELQGTVNIDFTANDAHLASIFLYIDNMVFNVTTQTSFQWNTTKIGDGAHMIKLVAVDSAGNKEETHISLWTTNVKEATEESYISGRDLGILAGAIFGVIASIASVVVGKRLRSGNLAKPQKKEVA